MTVLSRASSAELRNRIWQLADFLRSGDSFRGNSLSSYGFTCKRRIEGRAKRILAENTNRERVVLGRRDVRRPFDEVAKIVKIGSLHIVVSGFWTLRPLARNGHQHPYYGNSHEPRPKTGRTTKAPGLWNLAEESHAVSCP